MKTVGKKPEAVLEAFKKWIRKGRRLNLIQPARPEDHFEDVSIEQYNNGLFNRNLCDWFYYELARRGARRGERGNVLNKDMFYQRYCQ